MFRENVLVLMPPLLIQELRHNFDNRYRFGKGNRISWDPFQGEWCRELDTDPPTPPTVRDILYSGKNTCEYRIADGLCQLLSQRSYDEWIDRLRDEEETNLPPPEPIASAQMEELKIRKDVDQVLNTKTTTIKWEIRLEADEELADTIFALLKNYSGDASLTLRRIAQGSLILTLEGSRAGFERIEDLFVSGALTELLGVPVLQVQMAKNSETVNLSRWFQNIFEAGWQAVEELLTPQQLSPVFWDASVKGAKLIDLSLDLVKHTVILIISLTQEAEKRVNVRLQIYPQGQETYLPSNLQLLVKSEAEVLQEIRSRSADQFIQCQFSGSMGDRFSVDVTLGDVSVTENFVL